MHLIVSNFKLFKLFVEIYYFLGKFHFSIETLKLFYTAYFMLGMILN